MKADEVLKQIMDIRNKSFDQDFINFMDNFWWYCDKYFIQNSGKPLKNFQEREKESWDEFYDLITIFHYNRDFIMKIIFLMEEIDVDKIISEERSELLEKALKNTEKYEEDAQNNLSKENLKELRQILGNRKK